MKGLKNSSGMYCAECPVIERVERVKEQLAMDWVEMVKKQLGKDRVKMVTEQLGMDCAERAKK